MHASDQAIQVENEYRNIKLKLKGPNRHSELQAVKALMAMSAQNTLGYYPSRLSEVNSNLNNCNYNSNNSKESPSQSSENEPGKASNCLATNPVSNHASHHDHHHSSLSGPNQSPRLERKTSTTAAPIKRSRPNHSQSSSRLSPSSSSSSSLSSSSLLSSSSGNKNNINGNGKSFKQSDKPVDLSRCESPEPIYGLAITMTEEEFKELAEREGIEDVIGEPICKLCGGLFSGPLGIALHMCPAMKRQTYRCEICGEDKWKTKANLHSHIKWCKKRLNVKTEDVKQAVY